MTLYSRLVEVMEPIDIDHHESDLYVRKNNDSTRIINEYYNENKELKKDVFVSTFISNIPPHDKWYEIAFAYDPYWAERQD